MLANSQRNQSLYQAQLNISLAKQDAIIANQTAAAQVQTIAYEAAQNATAITAQYKALENTLIATTKANQLDLAGLTAFLKNQVVRSSGGLDVVMAP